MFFDDLCTVRTIRCSGSLSHLDSRVIYSGSQPVGLDPKRGRDTNAMGSLIDFDPNVNII